ncbi:uncharacterized protein P884DRAFT_53564 [Thermothelomyces heterothallicus CBS 202.75]|uniref:uncharacterized protein n=1 Tax=Thermothelomyces heterothallicus CBS 202.75 TaxID=1149848 RepID=UPI0037440200
MIFALAALATRVRVASSPSIREVETYHGVLSGKGRVIHLVYSCSCVCCSSRRGRSGNGSVDHITLTELRREIYSQSRREMDILICKHASPFPFPLSPLQPSFSSPLFHGTSFHSSNEYSLTNILIISDSHNVRWSTPRLQARLARERPVTDGRR